MLPAHVQADPVWDGGKLTVSPVVKQIDDPVARVCNLMCNLSRWRLFEDARFAGVGGSRCLLGSLLVGLDSMIVLVRWNPTNSGYNLHHWDLLL